MHAAHLSSSSLNDMKKFFEIYGGVILTLLLFVVMTLPVVVGAQINNQGGIGVNNQGGTNISNQGGKALVNPLGSSSLCGLILTILKALIALGVPIAVLFIVWAGFKFVLAQGSQTKLKEAKENFLNTVLGIAIFVGASLIITVVVNTVISLGVTDINTSCR
jgi:hypothetical protein